MASILAGQEPLPPFRARRDPSARRRPGRRLLWSTIALLIVGVGWLFYLGARDREAAWERYPALQAGIGAVSHRVDQAEQKLRAWDREAFGARLASFERALEANLFSARKNAQEISDRAVAGVRAEFSRRSDRIESRVAGLEDHNATEQLRLAALQDELTRVKQELSQHQARLAAAESNAAGDKAALEDAFDRRLSDVRRNVSDNRREVAAIAHGLEVQRIDFEVSKGHSRQLAPGVSLCVTGMDVSRRRVQGWMWIMPDRRTVWLKDHGAMQPVIFYSKADGKKREVVFTHVTRDSAVGYVLLPASAPPEPARGGEQRIAAAGAE